LLRIDERTWISKARGGDATRTDLRGRPNHDGNRDARRSHKPQPAAFMAAASCAERASFVFVAASWAKVRSL
jgi:hypothetical protein